MKRIHEVKLKEWNDSFIDPRIGTYIAYDSKSGWITMETTTVGDKFAATRKEFMDAVDELKKAATNKDAIILASYVRGSRPDTYILMDDDGSSSDLIAINLDHTLSYTQAGKLRLKTVFSEDSRKFYIGSAKIFEKAIAYLTKGKEQLQ